MRANVCTQQVRDCRLWLLLLLPAMVVAFTPLTPARMHLARSGGPEAVYRQATARITTRSLALRKAHVFRMVGSLEDQEQAETETARLMRQRSQRTLRTGLPPRQRRRQRRRRKPRITLL